MGNREMVPVDRVVIDSPGRINDYLMAAKAAGRLVQQSRATAVGNKYQVKVRVLEPRRTPGRPAPARAHRKPTVLGEMGRALAFVGALALAVLAVGFAFYLSLRGAFSADGVKACLGAAAVVGALALIATNRASHSGACPGIVVHCKGCRH